MKADGKYDRVVLCCIDGDDAAKSLYEMLGFHHTDDVDEDVFSFNPLTNIKLYATMVSGG